MNEVKNDILDQISNMSKDELINLDSIIKFYLLKVEEEQHPDEFLLFSIVNNKILSLTTMSVYFPAFKRSKKSYKKLKQTLRSLDKLIQKIEKKTFITTEMKAYFFNHCVDLVAQYMINYHIPLSITAILNCFDKILEILNIAYPGYYENNLLHLIFREDVLEDTKEVDR